MAKSVLAGPGGDAIRAQSPFGRVAEPEEVAEAAVFLCLGAGGFCSTLRAWLAGLARTHALCSEAHNSHEPRTCTGGEVLGVTGASYFR